NGKDSAIADTSGSFGFSALAKGKYTITAEDGVSAYTAETEITESAHKYLLIKDGVLYIEDDYDKIRSMFDILEFSLDKTVMELKPGETEQLTFSYKPEASAVNSVSYESSNPSIAAVEQDGTIIAKKTGSAEISVSVNGLPKKKCSVTVNSEDSAENSLLIVLIESGILLAALLVFIFMYIRYRKKHSGSEE
ncbi:MAG: Ig-like domain-containing protein, partial [Candidatus Limousia pullorum]